MVDDRQAASAAPSTATEAAVGAGPSEQLAAEPSGSATAAATPLSADRITLEFELAVEVIYHRSREAWFRGLHRAGLFATTILGASAVGSVMSPVMTGIAIAIIGAADLAIGFSAEASRHAEMRQRYLRAYRRLTDADFTPKALAKARHVKLRIDEEAPPPYRAVEDVAHYQATVSLGRDMEHTSRVTGIRYWTRHLWHHHG